MLWGKSRVLLPIQTSVFKLDKLRAFIFHPSVLLSSCDIRIWNFSFLAKGPLGFKLKEINFLQDSLKRSAFRTASQFSLQFYLLVCAF